MDGSRMKKLIKEGSKEVKDTILPIIVIIMDEVLRLLVVFATPDFFDNGIAMVIFFIQFILSIIFYCFYYGYFFEEKKNPFLRTKEYTQITGVTGVLYLISSVLLSYFMTSYIAVFAIFIFAHIIFAFVYICKDDISEKYKIKK